MGRPLQHFYIGATKLHPSGAATRRIMAEKLYPVVYDFLIGCGYTKTASKCLKEIGKSEAKMKTSESLVKIYDAYLKKSKVAAKKVESSDDDSSDDDEESEDEKKKTIVVATKKVVPVITIPAKVSTDSILLHFHYNLSEALLLYLCRISVLFRLFQHLLN